VRGLTLETQRLALTLAYLQPIPVVFGSFAFDLRGTPALVLIAASLAIAIAASIAAWILGLVARCPNCDGRYFSIVPLLVFGPRRCRSCGLRETDRVPPQDSAA
jgi:hypothetical protein